ncbi:beta-N-acetylhexosaminidase [Paenibacillus terrigena]|uniref:beta-N-acetylhexosaminidase n=1 Tax=Paenibacillus terrigena TaxID=369333 RepID=UPI0028D33F68|nr:beta-N-acetylhexosaminidase [Paenibacillus terrigena]
MSRINAVPPIVPSLREWTGQTGNFRFHNTTRIVIDARNANVLQEIANALLDELKQVSHLELTIHTAPVAEHGDLFLTMNIEDVALGEEGYVFDVSDSLCIQAPTAAGIFYGTRTLLQMLTLDADGHSHVPQGVARDYPSYRRRGIMLDVGRRYYSVPYLEDTIRRLSWHKLNTFQLHFSEWNGFRLQSETYPGLASTKSYSRADIDHLQAVAKRYHVMIIPEIEMPGHCAILNKYNPALKFTCPSMDMDTTGWSIPEFTVDYTRPETRGWLKKLVDEFIPWFESPYFHIGSDEIQTEECMKASSVLVDYQAKQNHPKIGDSFIEFINEMSEHVKQAGKIPMNWNGFEDYDPSIALHPDNIITVWSDEGSHSKQAIDFAQEGYTVYASPGNVLYVTPGKQLLPDYNYVYETWEPTTHTNITGYFLSIWSDYWDLVQTPDGRVGYESGRSFKGEEVGDGVHVIPESNFEDASRGPRQVLAERMWGGPRSASVAAFFERVERIGDEPSVRGDVKQQN